MNPKADSGKNPNKTVTTSLPILAAYCFFAVAGVMLYVTVNKSKDEDAPGFAAVFTLATMLQCLAMVLLAAQVFCTGSVSSISGRAVALEALSLVCRLTSTLCYNGYLPTTKDGDKFYQGVDLSTLGVSLLLLYQIYVQKRETYMESEDSFPIVALTLGCFVLAAGLHGCNNLRPFYDMMWMAGHILGTVSVLPQLSLIRRSGGRVMAITGHNIAIMAVGRSLAAYFLWLAREDIACDPYPWAHGIDLGVYAILGVAFLHALLVAKFAYHFTQALLTQGLHCEKLYLNCGASECEIVTLNSKKSPVEV